MSKRSTFRTGQQPRPEPSYAPTARDIDRVRRMIRQGTISKVEGRALLARYMPRE